MPDFNFNDEMQNYFDSLPKSLQQTIIMSDVKIDNIDELKSIAQGFLGNGNET